MIGGKLLQPEQRDAIVRDSAVRRALTPMWRLMNRATAGLERLTRRDADAERDDRTAEALFHGSQIGLALAAAGGAWARAWSHSIVGTRAHAVRSALLSVERLNRVRATCWLALVAAATALALRLVLPRVEPLTWIVPAAVATVAVVVLAATPRARNITA